MSISFYFGNHKMILKRRLFAILCVSLNVTLNVRKSETLHITETHFLLFEQVRKKLKQKTKVKKVTVKPFSDAFLLTYSRDLC